MKGYEKTLGRNQKPSHKEETRDKPLLLFQDMNDKNYRVIDFGAPATWEPIVDVVPKPMAVAF